MKLKYKVVLSLFTLSLICGFGGYAKKWAYVTLAGFLLFVLSITTLLFSDKDDKDILSIVIEGIVGIFSF